MGARHAQGVFVVTHNGPPGLGPLKDGNARGQSSGDLRVVIVDGGGTDHTARPLYALRQVADDHRDAQGPEVVYRLTFLHI